VGLLDAPGGRGALASGLRGELLAGGLPPGGLASGLLGTGHGGWMIERMRRGRLLRSETTNKTTRSAKSVTTKETRVVGSWLPTVE